MGEYKDAAEILFKRQFGVYGIEKIISLANKSGWEIDSSGNVLSVDNEKEAFARLCANVETELGPIAVIGSKLALMRHFAKSGNKNTGAVENIIGTEHTTLKGLTPVSTLNKHWDSKNDTNAATADKQPLRDEVIAVTKHFKSDYVLLTDFELKVIEANGNFMERHKDTLIIGKTLCQIFDITSPGTCPAEDCVNCPVKRSITTMSPVEMEMAVNGRMQHWRSLPFISRDSVTSKALVHIKDLSW